MGIKDGDPGVAHGKTGQMEPTDQVSNLSLLDMNIVISNEKGPPFSSRRAFSLVFGKLLPVIWA